MVLGFHVTSRDIWSLAFRIVETFWLNPSVPLEGYKWENPSSRKEEKNSTLREKLLWRNYSLHIESASLCPFNSEHIVHPPRSSLLDWEPHCLSYMSSPLVEDWSGGGPVGRNLVSWFRTVLTRKSVMCFASADHLLIEILLSRPIGIMQIYDYYPWACLLCLLMDYAI